MSLIKSVVASILALALSTLAAQAREAEVYTGTFSSLAVGGYDAVAYFKQGRPVVGNAAFATEYKGATWRFASKENLDAFKAQPAAYAPQYGGYCMLGMVTGNRGDGDPKAWKIVGGKLYLNYNEAVKKKWEEGERGYIEQGDRNWEEFQKQKPEHKG